MSTDEPKKRPHARPAAPALGYVISDLHIFARWSSAERYMPDIRAAASKADFFVFNGDIFDFKWSTLDSSAATALAAVDWFRELATNYPDCNFFYVLGNHDCHECLRTPLAELARELDNFNWHGAYCKFGSSLFLHGDLIFNARGPSPFNRTRFRSGEPQHAFLGAGYHFAIGMGAHSVTALVFAKEKCARQLLRVLDDRGHSEMKGVEDIYIGHTHTSFSDFKYKGFTFHNSGSAVHDLHCNMMQVSSKE